MVQTPQIALKNENTATDLPEVRALLWMVAYSLRKYRALAA